MIALQPELEIAPFRRNFSASPLYEGWDVSESLGQEMAFTTLPRRMGQLSYQPGARRASCDTAFTPRALGTRLVPSPSCATHRAHDANIDARSIATSASRGPALAYMIGNIRIRDLRASRKGAGMRFDLRRFTMPSGSRDRCHSTCSKTQVDAWIAEGSGARG
jgi:uncharacterized protein (DUF885 family)